MEGDSVYRIIELVGSSQESVEAAIQNAISRAGETVQHLDWFEVRETRGRIEHGQVGWYQVTLGVGYRMDAATPAGN